MISSARPASVAELPQLLAVNEVAQCLAVSTKTVRRMLARGELRPHRLGKNVRVDAMSVMRLIATAETQVAASARVEQQKDSQEDQNYASPMATQTERAPFRIHRDAQRGRFVMMYYGRDGTRRLRRLPRHLASEVEAISEAQRWFDRKIGRAAPVLPTVSRQLPQNLTFEQFGVLWTSGKLTELFPDHVRPKSSALDDARRLASYVYPIIGSERVADFEGARGLSLVESVLDGLPKPPAKFSKSSRRQIIQAVHRLLTLAVYPAKLLVANPLPKGFLPKVGKGRAKAYVYPSEDAALMRYTSAPLVERLFFGVLAREGMRVGEALGLTWSDLDLTRGVIHLDENKTEDPRTWALDPGVTAALLKWRKKLGNAATADSQVFAPAGGPRDDRLELASDLRRYLRLAGVERAQLFESSEARIALRAHDLRATFVTVNLALGRTEAWITDRTGHRSSQMIYTYKRAARTHAELELGEFMPLHEAIPDWD